MGKAPFETLAEAQRRASERLPASVYRALIAGALGVPGPTRRRPDRVPA